MSVASPRPDPFISVSITKFVMMEFRPLIAFLRRGFQGNAFDAEVLHNCAAGPMPTIAQAGKGGFHNLRPQPGQCRQIYLNRKTRQPAPETVWDTEAKILHALADSTRPLGIDEYQHSTAK